MDSAFAVGFRAGLLKAARGPALTRVYNAGRNKIRAIDSGRLGQRDEGWYGKGFYVSRDADYVKRWYGPTVTAFDVSLSAKVLTAAVDAKSAPNGLFASVMGNEDKLLKSRGAQDQRKHIENLLKTNHVEWVHAVDRYAEAEKFDVVVFNDNEIVVKNTKVLSPVKTAYSLLELVAGSQILGGGAGAAIAGKKRRTQGALAGQAGGLVGGAAGTFAAHHIRNTNGQLAALLATPLVGGALAGHLVRKRKKTASLGSGDAKAKINDRVRAFQARLRPGDIVNTSPRKLEGIVAKVYKPISEAVQGTPFGHSALYAGNGQIIEARIGEGVTEKPLAAAAAEHKLIALRVRGATAKTRAAAVAYARKNLGKDFSLGQLAKGGLAPTALAGARAKVREKLDAFFCSQLVANAWHHVPFHAERGQSFTRPVDILKSEHVEEIAKLAKKRRRRRTADYLRAMTGHEERRTPSTTEPQEKPCP